MEAWAKQMVVFASVMRVFEDEDAAEEEVLAAADTVRAHLALAGEGGAAVSPGFEHWAAAFTAARAARTRASLKDWARLYLCTPSPHGASPHNVTQGIMEASVHLVWRRLYAAEAGRLRTDIAEAVRDAAIPRRERSIEFMQALLAEIAAETNETAEAMMARVCGDEPALGP